MAKGLADFYAYQLDFNGIEYGEFGKPYLPNTGWHFNISHSKDLVVCAIQADAEVGADVEYITPISIDDFKGQMTKKEWLLVNKATDPMLAFYDYWTSKEAVLKVEGSGIQLGLKTFEVAENRKTAVVKGRVWYLYSCEPDADYCCYLASARAFTKRPIVRRFTF